MKLPWNCSPVEHVERAVPYGEMLFQSVAHSIENLVGDILYQDISRLRDAIKVIGQNGLRL